MAFLNTAKSRFTNNIKGQVNELVEAFTGRTFAPGSERLIFPSEMEEVFDSRPMINFTCKPSKNIDDKCGIFLPCPTNIAFTDGANYSSIDLGTIGNLAGEAAGKAIKLIEEKGIGGALKGAVDTMKSAASGSAKALAKSALGTVGAYEGGQLGFATKTVTNPRQNTKFDANTLRNFTFSFKLIARTQAEAKRVKDIHTAFRYGVYASATNSEIDLGTLKYPPTWVIRFMLGGEENPYMPKILRCYLASVGTTFNSTGNTWRVDGAPLEVDITLSFTETRVLTRNDIEKLEKPGVNRDDFEQKTGAQSVAEAVISSKKQQEVDNR